MDYDKYLNKSKEIFNELEQIKKVNGFSQEEHFEVAKDITNLYENASLKTAHADYKNNPNIFNVYRFNIDAEVNGKETIAKITVLGRIEGCNKLYTIELANLTIPLLNTSRVPEAEVAKSLSSDATPHNDLSIYCDFDNETIPQNSSECQEQDDSNDESNESTHTRRKL